MNTSNYKKLRQFIFEEGVGDDIPSECSDLLHIYIGLELDGENAAEAYPQVQACLESSPTFHQLYQSMKKLIADERQGILIEPPSYTVPDQDFIHSLLSADSTKQSKKLYLIQWAIKEAGQLIVHLRGEAHRKAQELLDDMNDAVAVQQLQLSGPMRGKTTQLPKFQLKGALDDLEIEIKTSEIEGEPTLCQVAVQVNIPSLGGWPKLGNTKVALSNRNEEIETQSTDAYGVALFDRISITDLDYLMFEIVPSR